MEYVRSQELKPKFALCLVCGGNKRVEVPGTVAA